jgi:hypothetical protein
MAALGCALASGRCEAQSAKLARQVPEWGVNAAIESDLLGTKPGPAAKIAERQLRDERAVREDNKKLRILLVGNSYTRFNLLHMLIERLAEASGGPRVQVEIEARAGYSLRMHLKSKAVLSKIRYGRYSHVVLQGHSLSAIDHPDELAEDAERFAAAIAAAGSRAVLFETWARKPETSLYKKHASLRTFDEMVSLIETAYWGIARRLQIGLAPVGNAFERAWRQDPAVPLWGSDGSHPKLAGSYMAACVIYGAVTGRDPRDATWEPFGVDRRLAAHIRDVAAVSLAGVTAVGGPSSSNALAAMGGGRSSAGLAKSAKVHRASAKPEPHVAASMTAFMGAPPGAPEPAAQDDDQAAGSDGAGDEAAAPDEDSDVRAPAPSRELDVKPEKASYVPRGRANIGSSAGPVLVF